MPPGVCYGRLDVPLLDGWQHAMPLIASIAAASMPSRVLSSPATRCRLPARALAALLGVAVATDPDLQELDFGAWEGISWDAAPREALDRWAADPLGFAPPGGESGALLLERVGRAARRLCDEGRSVLVLTHGGPLRLLPALLRGRQPDLLAQTQPMGAIRTVALA